MNIHFLGTAASEGWPAVFCRCEHCLQAKRLGGKNIRTRASVIIDETLKIDFPPDTYHHVLREGIDLAAVEHLLLTHSHSDHLQPDDLKMRRPPFAHGVEKPLHIYGHDRTIHSCRQAIASTDDLFEFHLIQPFQPVQIDNETTVTPLLADHDKQETCLLYFIEKNGKALLYGHDSGWFPQQTWEWLKARTFDAAILDCTNGPLPGRRNHMNIDAILEMNDHFRQKRLLRDNGQVIATHFSHNGGLLHDELVDIFTPHGVTVAFDGMRCTVPDNET